jgi:hypothetical protein
LPQVVEVAEKVLLVLLPAGPDERDFLTGRANSHVSPDSVTKDSSLRFSRRGDLLLLLLLVPRSETEREGDAKKECSIALRFHLLKATACSLETLILAAQGK